MVALPAGAEARDVELAPEDRLDLRLLGGLVQRDRAEHVPVVGHGDRAHPRGGHALDEVLDLHRPVEKRVLRVNVEVVVLCGHVGSIVI